MRASDFEIRNYEKLDRILSKLCDMVDKGQASEKDYGMVAAAVLDPSNQIVARLNRPTSNGQRIHAERAAMEAYEKAYGAIPEGSIIITTCSPCSEHMDERYGESCTDLINNSVVKKVYAGFMDPTQEEEHREFNIMETEDESIRSKCKEFASAFLGTLDEATFGGQEVEGNAYEKFKDKFPNLSTVLYFIPGLSQALVAADMASAIHMYNQAIAQIEQKYPLKIIRTVQVQVGDDQPLEPFDENFADGKNPQDKGDSKRHGINTKASVSSLRKTAKQGGRKGQLAHWLANMKAGRNK